MKITNKVKRGILVLQLKRAPLEGALFEIFLK